MKPYKPTRLSRKKKKKVERAQATMEVTMYGRTMFPPFSKADWSIMWMLHSFQPSRRWICCVA